MSAATSKSSSKRVTLRHLRKAVRDQQKIPMLTCYDATMAQLLWRGGLESLLVGDTAGQFILGHENTISVKMAFMLSITASVRRGAPNAFLMADMPFGSYHCGDDEAMRHAVSFMADAGADVVKLEVDASHRPLVARMSAAGVPVVAHLGSRPQQKLLRGRYRQIYHNEAEVAELVQTAEEMIDAGAVMVLLEAIPQEAAKRVVDAVVDRRSDGEPVPVIGCGAGPDCHGHVVVVHDVMGLSDWHAPFAKPLADVGQQVIETAGKWVDLVRSGQYLRDDHPYHLES